MTCRGYDAKAVKVNKSIKRVAATLLDNQQRKEYIRGYVRAIATNNRMSTRRNRAEQ